MRRARIRSPDETDRIRVIVLLLSYRSSWWSTTIHDKREIKREKREDLSSTKNQKRKSPHDFTATYPPNPRMVISCGRDTYDGSQASRPNQQPKKQLEREKPRITDSSLPQRPKPPTAEPPPPPAFLFLAPFDDERSRFIGGGHQHRLPLPRRLLLWRWDCRYYHCFFFVFFPLSISLFPFLGCFDALSFLASW